MTVDADLADSGLQAERTALAWERTAISIVVTGVLLTRIAALEGWWALSVGGVVQTAAGAAILVWTGSHHEDLHGPLRRGESAVHPLAARIAGLLAVFGCGLGLAVGVGIAIG